MKAIHAAAPNKVLTRPVAASEAPATSRASENTTSLCTMREPKTVTSTIPDAVPRPKAVRSAGNPVLPVSRTSVAKGLPITMMMPPPARATPMAPTTRRIRGWVATKTIPSRRSRKGAMRLRRPVRRRRSGRSCPAMAIVETMAAEIRKVPASTMKARPSAVPGSRPPRVTPGLHGASSRNSSAPSGKVP